MTESKPNYSDSKPGEVGNNYIKSNPLEKFKYNPNEYKSMGISNNGNAAKMSGSKDLISQLKEVLNPKELKLITEVLKQIKDEVDVQTCSKHLYGIFFKAAENPQAVDNFEMR